MQKFIFGLLIGLTLSSGYFIFTSKRSENSSNLVNTLVRTYSEEQADIKQINSVETQQQPSKITNRVVDIRPKTTLSNEIGLLQTRGQDKDRIEKILGGLNDYDLTRVESFVSSLYDKTPSEKFELENIDSKWSLEKQAELEYSFYESSALRDLGNLESVICKSQSCQVKVSIPSDLELRPSHFVDWSNPVETTLIPHFSDPESKTLVIYVKRRPSD